MSYKQRLGLVAGILVISIVLDQITKRMAIAWLMDSPPHIYLGDFFRLQYAENTGAFLGLFGQMSSSARTLLLVGFNAVILTAVSVYLALPRERMTIVVIALALILSGGIGNLIDRIAYSGIVVDFLNMGLPWVSIRGWEPRTGIFNIADLAIVGGLLLMIVAEFLKPDDTESGAEATSDDMA